MREKLSGLVQYMNTAFYRVDEINKKVIIYSAWGQHYDD